MTVQLQIVDGGGARRSPRPADTGEHTGHTPRAVKTVDAFTVREILRIRDAFDSPPATAEPSYYWVELLKDCSESDALEATWAHYRVESRSIWPADILTTVRELGDRRRTAVGRSRERYLLDRAVDGYGADALTRWSEIFDVEVRRGAGRVDAATVADGAVPRPDPRPTMPASVAPGAPTPQR